MKLIIKIEKLLKAFNVIERAIVNTTGSSLSGIRFSFRENNSLKDMILTTTNNKITISYIIRNVDVEDEVEFLISGKHLIEICRKIGKDDVEIRSQDNSIYLKKNNFRVRLQKLDIDKFPKEKPINKESLVKLEGKDFIEILKKTVVAASVKSLKPTLASICLSVENGKIFSVATDTFRLAYEERPTDVSENIKIIIPITTVQELNRIIEEGKLNILLGRNRAIFYQKDWKLETRLINDIYPDVIQYFQVKFLFKEKFNRLNLITILERISILETASVKMSFHDGSMIIFSKKTELGDAEDMIQVETKNDFDISLSMNYFLDALNSFTEDNVEIFFAGDMKPIVITDSKTHKHLILPVRQ